MNPERQTTSLRPVVLSSVVLGLVWMGDALIYVVLPLYADAFGIPLTLVGVVLSLNRIVRILGYGWLGQLSRRFAAHKIMAVSAAMGAISTLAYGLLRGVVALLAARLLWGLAYGILNVFTTVYATGDGGIGRRIGLSRAISTCGPVLALSIGAYLAVTLGPQEVFIVLGAVGLAAIPLALLLPDLRDLDPENSPPPGSRWRPSSLHVLFFTIGLVVDGVFPMTLSLILAQTFSPESAVLAAGLTLLLLRTATLVGSLVGGDLADRMDARRVLAVASIALLIGLVGVAAGRVFEGAAIIILTRAVLWTVGPVLVLRERGGTKVERLAAFSTWVDCGLAAGPLLAGLLFLPLGAPGLYLLLAATLGATLVCYFILTRTSVRGSP